MSDPASLYRPGRNRHPVPHGSALTQDEWRRANHEWRRSRPHPLGVAEPFAWGAVMWAPTGSTPWGVVVADPGVPVGVAHAAARELGAPHLRQTRQWARPIPVRAGWAATAGFLPTMFAVGAVAPGALGWAAGAAVGTVAGTATGFRRRLERGRRWRHIRDVDGAGRVFPQLRWLTDLVLDVPDQADLVWSGVREILWHAPRLGAAANPVAQVAEALARTAAVRRAHDALVRGDTPGVDQRSDTGRIDDIAEGLVGALDLEEQVYRRLLEERAERDADTAPIISLRKNEESA